MFTRKVQIEHIEIEANDFTDYFLVLPDGRLFICNQDDPLEEFAAEDIEDNAYSIEDTHALIDYLIEKTGYRGKSPATFKRK